MFYDVYQKNEVLTHDPMKALVSPRPIGWIGSFSASGVANIAPYSFFNLVSSEPAIIMFSSDGMKDSARNILSQKEFTVSIASRHLADSVNQTSVPAPSDVSEFDIADLKMKTGKNVNAPYVGDALAVLECKFTQSFVPETADDSKSSNQVVLGQVVGVHIDDTIIKNGCVDMGLLAPLARLGYMDFCDGSDVFQLTRPKWPLK